MTPHVTLGISALFHNSAAALCVDGAPVAALEEERVSRLKNDARFPRGAIACCMAKLGLTTKSVDEVAYYERPLYGIYRAKLAGLPPAQPTASAFTAQATLMRELATLFEAELPIYFFPHHLSHAASAFLASDFDESVVVVADAVGETLSTSVWLADSDSMRCAWKMSYPHSLGLLYSYVTSYLGFRALQDEYKVMGLAALGRAGRVDLSKLVLPGRDGEIEIAPDWRQVLLTGAPRADGADQKLLGARRQAGVPFEQHHADLAAAVQELLTDWLDRVIQRAWRLGGGRTALCLAGGVAHNCRALGVLQETAPFSHLFVQPAAGDAGAALGAAMLPQYLRNGRARSRLPFDPYLGPSYSRSSCRDALLTGRLKWTEHTGRELIQRVAADLVDGKVVGWFCGAAEFGPRALGNRSILANPLIPSMAAIVNARVKQRESFRPFAPAVQIERYEEFFEGRWADRYMMVTGTVRTEHRDRLSSVMHVDNSARVQLVDSRLNKAFHDLLGAFAERTGYPLLLNTSLNHSSEPMALSPSDALRTAALCDLDVLVVGEHYVELGQVQQ